MICGFWNKSQGNWSDSGCSLRSSESILNDSIVRTSCECNHLTDFGLGDEILGTLENSGF